jgi:N-acetylmuramoyl-L-alanine amidase
MVNSIKFDDSDGISKIVLDVTKETADITLNSTDNNRLFFVDLKTKREAITESGAPAAVPVPKADLPQPQTEHRVRVIVIDPGHGGMDIGAQDPTLAEKDLTLILARKLRAALQTRLGATVLLTRDSDIALDNEARSAVANNNQANLFISLHAGYSPNKLDSSSSVFIMKEGFGESFGPAAAGRDTLFLPWYLGYRTSQQSSARAAKILQEELSKTIPGWQFPVRTAPLALLSSVTMPSLLLEIGNLNNPVNAQTLTDSAFQNRLVSTIVDAVQRFSQTPQPSAN